MSVRNMQRKREAYQEYGYTGLFDQRRGKRSIHRVPMDAAEKVLGLYQERYFDLSVLHFHEKLAGEHSIRLSYTPNANSSSAKSVRVKHASLRS